MKYLGLDYRISLLRVSIFQGSSHQAAMVFQVVVPKQLRALDIGRHRLQFIYQTPAAFTKTNVPNWLDQMKSEAGFAKVAGVGVDPHGLHALLSQGLWHQQRGSDRPGSRRPLIHASW